MTDDSERIKPRGRRASTIPPPTIPEESISNSTITALINSNPLVEPNDAVAASINNGTPRTRRRSSVSILQALVGANQLLHTKDARGR